MRYAWLMGLAAVLLGALPLRAGATTLDLSGPTSKGGTGSTTTAGVVNNAYFEVGSIHPAGTGVFVPFLTIQNKGQEQGYNTDGPTQFDEKRQPTWTHSLLKSSLATVISPNGKASYLFTLDINESANTPLISLDTLQIYQGHAGDYHNLDLIHKTFADAGATSNLAYDMDPVGVNDVLLNYYVVSKGSGSSDLNVYVPVADFNNLPGNDYIYLYAHFGGYTASPFNFSTDAGFEEWRGLPGSSETPPPAVPLPSTAVMGLTLLGFLLLQRGMRSRASGQLV
jgi:hypothetical protein